MEPGGVHVLEKPLSCAGHDGPDPEAELVDQVVSHERVVEAAGALRLVRASGFGGELGAA